MDGEDFIMPSPKRQRTESPESLKPTETAVEPQVQPIQAEQASKLVAAGAISQDENEMLDALMQHVEAEATPNTSNGIAVSAAAINAQSTIQIPGDSRVETKSFVREDPVTNDIKDGVSDTRADGVANVPESATVEGTQPENGLQLPRTSHSQGQLTDIERAALQIDGIPPTEAIEPVTGGDQPEWEVDSSPYESSSDSDSTDSSDDDSGEDDDDADGDYAMLDPEEAARILMQGDAGSDDEVDRSRNRGEGSGLRTANEQAEDVPPIPDIAISEDMKIEELGSVEAVVEKNVLIKGKVSGEYRVLESGSLLCLQNRSVAGVVAETLGRVEAPLYTVRFRTEDEIQKHGISERGTIIYYVPQHSTFVFTQPLKAYKGSDASNFHDEEVGDDEMEFSDDEAEAEHKRQLKFKRQGRSGETGRGRGSGRGAKTGSRGGYKPSPLSTDVNGAAYNNGSMEMNYDDIEEGEEGYTPLARPNNLHDMMNPNNSVKSSGLSHMPPPPFSDRGRGRGQHRGGRGHDRGGRGGRGNYRGNFNNSRGAPSYQNNQSPTNYQHPYPNPFQQGQFPYTQPPSAPSLTPHNPSYPYSAATSPMSPLPKSQFNFNTGFQGQQSLSPTFQQQQQQQQQWPQQMPGNFMFNAPSMMQFAQQFHQGQPQQPQQHNSGWQINQAAAAEVQRQLEEMRRAQGGNGQS